MGIRTACYNTLLKRKKAVSFDIFDTLLERDVERPTDVFLKVGDRVLGPGQGDAFRKARVEAEAAARQKAPRGECTLEEIYEELLGWDKETTEALKIEELRAELEGCFVKASMKPVFDACLQRGQTVFLISDMYLPREIISGMVARCGYEGYEELFVSNVYRVSKRSGGLFKEALKAYGLSSRDLIHVGDSLGADLLGAFKAGVAAVPVSRKNRLKRLVNRP